MEKKITMATLKSFIRKNAGNLYVKELSSFSGYTDCVEKTEMDWTHVSAENAIGHQGVYCVGSSNDSLAHYKDDKYIGIEVYNCCGCGILATQK